MERRTDYTVTISAVVKADSAEAARRYASERMGKWFSEDIGQAVPFPQGTLLYYSTKVNGYD